MKILNSQPKLMLSGCSKERVPSAYGLARHLSVSPTTIIAWRKLPEYESKRKALLRLWTDRLRNFFDIVKVGPPNLAELLARLQEVN
jgi:hypothetical protein